MVDVHNYQHGQCLSCRGLALFVIWGSHSFSSLTLRYYLVIQHSNIAMETGPFVNDIGDSHEFEAGMTSVSVACIYISSLPALPTRLELGGWGVFQWCNHDRDWHAFCCEHRDLQIATEFWQETSPKLHLCIYLYIFVFCLILFFMFYFFSYKYRNRFIF